MVINIKPVDTLFFRNSKPFEVGGENWAEIVFPPLPRTVYGALRTYLILQKGSIEEFKQGKFEEDLGTIDTYGKFKLKGIFLNKDGTLYFKIPYDSVLIEGKDKLKTLELMEKPKLMISNYPLEYVLFYRGGEKVEEPSGWIDTYELKKYLTGKDATVSKNSFYKISEKIGIARDEKSLSSKESYIYKIPLVQLERDVCISAVLEDSLRCLFDKEVDMLQLGGERKSAVFEIDKTDIDDDLNDLKDLNVDLKDGFFKVCLLTPTVFKKGWLPSWIDEATKEGKIGKLKVKLVAAATGRYIKVGGWDLARNKPKPLKKAVPAGAVYYFKLLEGDEKDVFETFHFKNISDEFSEEGFGFSVVGVVNGDGR
ncbi:type III-B CRISPR module-associated protein Cmr3 [Pseudothermotoga thermarum]|uniref:CRISPR-associated protein, Cmr3 family n=1 Tax=Pseudothermotoga thermarum DSM 5069 TaxID=688269 RepID=F7YTM2_9THEM|nr:type III-B CRISPR module-associated protein Cmr3 [Pseudothermotoga thermarum]AEH51244.1 CRISPR-associated protein, Cmr3 family [Pseudothermotoga thermarum DSM 5069]